MATSLDARIDEALLGPHAEKEWEATLTAGLEAALAAPLGDLLDPVATADFVDMLAERAFLNDTAKPLAAALGGDYVATHWLASFVLLAEGRDRP